MATCDVMSGWRAGQLEVVVRLDHYSLLLTFCKNTNNRITSGEPKGGPNTFFLSYLIFASIGRVAVDELRLHHIALRLMANKMGSGKS